MQVIAASKKVSNLLSLYQFQSGTGNKLDSSWLRLNPHVQIDKLKYLLKNRKSSPRKTIRIKNALRSYSKRYIGFRRNWPKVKNNVCNLRSNSNIYGRKINSVMAMKRALTNCKGTNTSSRKRFKC